MKKFSGTSWTNASAVMLAVFICLAAGSAAAQNLNPAYLKELPSVDRVMNDMKTSDPAETAARQMGALLQLKKMIEDAAGPRFFSRTTGLTPDETRLRQQYYTAYYNLSQSKPELKGLNALRGYDVDPKFRDELFKLYFSPAFQAQVKVANAPALARAAASDAANTQAAQAMMKKSAAPPKPVNPPPATASASTSASTSQGQTPGVQSSTAAPPLVSAIMGDQPGCAGALIASAFCVQGYQYLATNNLEQNADAVAQQNFNSAVQNDPNVADAYMGLALLAYNHMHYDTAVEKLKDYVALRPQDAEASLELGLTYYDLRQYGPAADALRKAIALKLNDPNDLLIATQKLNLAASGKAPAGPPAGDKAMALVNQGMQAWADVHGSSTSVSDDYAQAMNDYVAAQKINPRLEDIYLAGGIMSWEYQANNLPNTVAVSELKNATLIAPDDRRAWCQLGMVYFNTGQWADAATALEQADKLRANDVCLQDLAKSYVALGRKADATNVYKKLQTRNKEIAAMVLGAIQTH
jgi:tetratricopeptide (TPR) repeat protein